MANFVYNVAEDKITFSSLREQLNQAEQIILHLMKTHRYSHCHISKESLERAKCTYLSIIEYDSDDSGITLTVNYKPNIKKLPKEKEVILSLQKTVEALKSNLQQRDEQIKVLENEIESLSKDLKSILDRIS